MAKKKQSRPPVSRTLTVAFDQVKNGKSRLIAGYYNSETSIIKQDNSKGYEVARTLEYDVTGRRADTVNLKKIQAVSDFLTNAKKKDTVNIYTKDKFLLETWLPISVLAEKHEGKHLPAFKTKSLDQLNGLRERFKEFNISPIASPDHKKNEEKVAALIHNRINDIKNPNRESKGYIDRHVMTARNG